MGFQEVPFGEFQDARAKAEEKGYTVAAEREENGYPEYELKNGDVIRGDKQGGFNRMEGGEPQERWSVGTVNQYSQEKRWGLETWLSLCRRNRLEEKNPRFFAGVFMQKRIVYFKKSDKILWCQK